MLFESKYQYRIIVFDADTGDYKRMWGAFGNAPDDAAVESELGPDGAAQFMPPVHAVKVSNDGLVYVADRAGRRVQRAREHPAGRSRLARLLHADGHRRVWCGFGHHPLGRLRAALLPLWPHPWLLEEPRQRVAGHDARPGRHDLLAGRAPRDPRARHSW